jgi:hypothetical protein
MKETLSDTKIYGRALDRAAEISTPPSLDETIRRFARRVGLDAIMSFEDEVDTIRATEDRRLRLALEVSRDKFAFYAEQHHAKGTEESTAKAIVNEQMVAMISLALGDR